MTLGRWLIDLPTRAHLWSAERELRLARAEPQSRAARLHQLDVLRDYRRSRLFPRNTVSRRPTPVFVDDDGRRCAVAHLMIESGASAAAEHVAATTPCARIHELDPAPLDQWAYANGLTRTELARIQPTYGATPPDVISAVATAMWVLGPAAFVLAVAATTRLAMRSAIAWLGALTAAIGLATTVGGVLLIRALYIDGWIEATDSFGGTQEIDEPSAWWLTYGNPFNGAGVLSLIVGAFALVTGTALLVVWYVGWRRRARLSSAAA